MHAARPRGPAAARLLTDEDGLAALEFAFVAPVLLLIAFSVVLFSIYLATWLGVSQAAAEGARAAVAGLSTTERKSLAQTRVTAVIGAYAPLLDPTKAQVAYPVQAQGFFAVTVTYPVSALNLASLAPFTTIPSVSPARTSTVTVGGY